MKCLEHLAASSRHAASPQDGTSRRQLLPSLLLLGQHDLAAVCACTHAHECICLSVCIYIKCHFSRQVKPKRESHRPTFEV